MSLWLRLIVGFAIGFGLGSIPTSYLAGRLIRRIDLREHGSGNLGATNVARVLGWWAAVPVLVIDVGKGALAVWIASLPFLRIESVPDAAPLLAACGAILGHSYSPFVAFAGGKGVATAAGAFLTLAPWGMVPAFCVWLLLLLTTRIMSIASLAAAAVLPVTLIGYEIRHHEDGTNWATLATSVVVGALVYFRHRSNIQRLRSGTEKVLW